MKNSDWELSWWEPGDNHRWPEGKCISLRFSLTGLIFWFWRWRHHTGVRMETSLPRGETGGYLWLYWILFASTCSEQRLVHTGRLMSPDIWVGLTTIAVSQARKHLQYNFWRLMVAAWWQPECLQKVTCCFLMKTSAAFVSVPFLSCSNHDVMVRNNDYYHKHSCDNSGEALWHTVKGTRGSRISYFRLFESFRWHDGNEASTRKPAVVKRHGEGCVLKGFTSFVPKRWKSVFFNQTEKRW